jgi:hypothetical protein
LRSYVNSYEAGLSSTIPEYCYSWVPSDDRDNLFRTDYFEFDLTNNGASSYAGVTNSGEVEANLDHCRNAIYIKMNSTTAD